MGVMSEMFSGFVGYWIGVGIYAVLAGDRATTTVAVIIGGAAFVSLLVVRRS